MKSIAFSLFFCLFFANCAFGQCNLTITAENTNFCNNKINFVLSNYQTNGDAVYKINFGDGSGILEFTSAELDNMSGKLAEHTYNSASCLQTGEVFTFRVTVVGGACGFLEFTKTVKIAQKPTAQITSKNKYESSQNYNSTNYVCWGEFITVTNSSTSGYNPDCSTTTTYVLQDDNGFTSVNRNDTKSYQYFSSVERNIEIWAFNECNPSATDFSIAKLKIIVTPLPSFSDLGTISVCSNVSKEIGASVTNQNYMNYTWTAVGSVPAILSHTDQSKAQASIIFTSIGTYQYTLKATSYGGCSLEKILTFNVEEPTISFSTASIGGSPVGNEISVCPNANFTLYANQTGGKYIVGTTEVNSQTYTLNPAHIDDTNGTKVKYQLPSGCFKEITIKKYPTLTPTINLSNTNYCNIDQVHTFSASVTPSLLPTPKGVWSGVGLVDANNGIFNFHNVPIGEQKIYYQAQGNGCDFFATATLNIIDNTTVKITNTKNELCTNEPITLNAEINNTPTTEGSFEISQGKDYATIESVNRLTPKPKEPYLTFATVVTVLYKYGSNCSTSKDFTIYPLPQITFNQFDNTSSTNQQQFCEGTLLPFITSNVNGSWTIKKDGASQNLSNTALVSFGDDKFSMDSNKQLFIFTTVSHTLRNYELVFNASSEKDCKSEKSIFLQFNPLPKVKGIAANRTVCKASITFTPLENAINGTGTWSGIGLQNASTGEFDFSTVSAGEFDITYTYTITATGCSFPHTEKIKVKDFDIVTAGADQETCSNTDASMPNFIELSDYTSNTINYDVNFSIESGGGKIESFGVNQFKYYPPLTFVPLTVKLKYEHGLKAENCKQTKTKFITVYPAPYVVPSETQQNLSFNGKKLIVCSGRNITISVNPTQNAVINQVKIRLNGDTGKELNSTLPVNLWENGVKFSLGYAAKKIINISIPESYENQTYHIRYDLTSSPQNCTYTDFLTVEVLGIPQITFENVQDTYCKNDKDVLLGVSVKINGKDVKGSDGSGTWRWTTNASDFMTAYEVYQSVNYAFAKYATFNFKNATVGTYDLIYEYTTNTSDICVAKVVKKITIKEPQLIEAGDNQEVCINDFLTVSYVLPTNLGNGFYTVTNDKNHTFTQQNLAAISLQDNIFRATKAGTYKIDLVYDYGTVNCEIRDSKLITVHPLPTLSFISTNAQTNKLGDYQICRNGEIPTFKVEENVVRWHEKRGNTWVQFLTTATFTPSTINTSIPKTHEWGVSFQNPITKCFSEIFPFTLKIPENFVKLKDQTVCQEDQVILDPAEGNKNFKYSWTDEEGKILTTDSVYKFNAASSLFFSSPLLQTIFVKVTNDKTCEDTASVRIRIIPKIRNNQITAPEVLCSKDKLIVKHAITNNLSGGNGFFTVTWQYSFEGSNQWYDIGKDTPFKVNNQSDNSIEPEITQTTFFRRKVESSICLSFSNTTKVRYIKTPTITVTVKNKQTTEILKDKIISKCYGETRQIGFSVDTDNTRYTVYKTTESATDKDIEGGDLSRINDVVGTNIKSIDIDINKGYEYYKVIAVREKCVEQIWFRVDAIEIQENKLDNSYAFCPDEKINIVFPDKTNYKGEKYDAFTWEIKSGDSWSKVENAKENILETNKAGYYRIGVSLKGCTSYDEFTVYQSPAYQAEILQTEGDIFVGCNTKKIQIYPKIHKYNPNEKVAYNWFRVEKVDEKFVKPTLAAGKQADNSFETTLQGWFMLEVSTTLGNKTCKTYDYVLLNRALAPQVENFDSIPEKMCLEDNLNFTLKGSFQNNGLLQIIRNGKDTVYNASQNYILNPKNLGRGNYDMIYKVIYNPCNYPPLTQKFMISGLNAAFRLKDHTLELVADDSIKKITWQATKNNRDWDNINSQTTKIILDDKDKYVKYRATVEGRTCKESPEFTYLLVGTEKHNFLEKFETYPNPVSERLEIRLQTKSPQNVSLKLQTIEGKTIFEDFMSNRKALENYFVYCRNLPNGTYLLWISIENNFICKKIVVQH